ncbi:HTH domain-containing protein [Cryobacterium sp. PAMC25264]|uniref:HTH domain-containing protein n=1 Tax=Cryobacterium sp. PAMC25264 TaxID=2861288 RepID=UPI001C62DE7A|nr:HTH domain-containing protein [Cryobacterium sp. PAMC25264]QYF75157.1 hypothetical protein KY500_08785 [Cryobacterium sp. PAMC25264]
MNPEIYDTGAELRRIIAAGQVSEDALEAITGISAEKLRSFLDDARPRVLGLTSERLVLSTDESTRLSVLAAQLTVGLPIGDDERLRATIESLTVECRLTLANIARLTGLAIDDLASALRDPRTVSLDTKFRLAGRCSYLINAVNRARDPEHRPPTRTEQPK